MIQSISQAAIFEKDILVRVDLNVPFKNNQVSDSSRMQAIKPTIDLILNKGGRPILLSHFGRPKKKFDTSFSLQKILPTLTKVMKSEILFCSSVNPRTIKSFLDRAPKNKIILLENIRFHDGEEINSTKLNKIFSEFADLFCNDAFSVSHRSHSSTEGIAKILPSYSGLLLEKELSSLDKALHNSKRPLVAIVGGSKVSTKIQLLNSLIKRVDHIIIGGGMANTLLYSQNKEIGRSLCEKDFVEISVDIMQTAKKLNCQIHLPLDLVCADKFDDGQEFVIRNINSCPPDKMILDCGPKTVANVKTILESCKTLIWNGPLGAFEIPPFNVATNTVAKIVANLTKKQHLESIAGGGDTLAALNEAGVTNDFTYVSNAGGAFLEWLEGNELPGLKALRDHGRLTRSK